MITLIILTLLVGLGIYLFRKGWDYEIPGVIIIVVFGIWLLGYSASFFTQKYYYGLFVEKRNAFEITLQKARKNGNEYETAAIVKEVSNWNMKLAENKYDNKNWFLGQYIDDRIETLEPIE